MPSGVVYISGCPKRNGGCLIVGFTLRPLLAAVASAHRPGSPSARGSPQRTSRTASRRIRRRLGASALQRLLSTAKDSQICIKHIDMQEEHKGPTFTMNVHTTELPFVPFLSDGPSTALSSTRQNPDQRTKAHWTMGHSARSCTQRPFPMPNLPSYVTCHDRCRPLPGRLSLSAVRLSVARRRRRLLAALYREHPYSRTCPPRPCPTRPRVSSSRSGPLPLRERGPLPISGPNVSPQAALGTGRIRSSTSHPAVPAEDQHLVSVSA